MYRTLCSVIERLKHKRTREYNDNTTLCEGVKDKRNHTRMYDKSRHVVWDAEAHDLSRRKTAGNRPGLAQSLTATRAFFTSKLTTRYSVLRTLQPAHSPS